MNRFAIVTATALLAVGTLGSAGLGSPVSVSKTSPNPLQLTGTSGGPQSSKDCGFVPAAPSQVLVVGDRLDRVRLEVQASGGQPTLLVNGPGGRYCVIGPGNTLEMSGVWMPGRYEVSIGDRAGGSHRYTLEVSQP